MAKSISSIRRLTENEAIFRKHNEKVTKELAEVQKKANEVGQGDDVNFNKLILHFFCECADEDCKERIKIKVNDYRQLHMNRDYFVVKVGHQVKGIERILEKYPQYLVVEKFFKAPENPIQLHKTQVSNA